jgi:hypothetical protein
MSKKIDVIISVCGKPWQTALALLSLDRECGRHIDKIYFTEENTKSYGVDIQSGQHEYVLEKLKNKIVYFMPKQWNYCFQLEFEKLGDLDYRHSVRYQYGWEMSDKDHVLIIHNDAYFHGDVVSAMLGAMEDHIAIGHVGQCWYCPAAFTHKCDSDHYLEYRPDYAELYDLYRKTIPPKDSLMRAYHLPFMHDIFLQQSWPLPECRVNEWCAMINMKQARKLTFPAGRVTPFGAIINVGKQILDVGCQWFREMHARGHTAKNFNIYEFMHHDVPPTGQPTLLEKEKYIAKEEAALARLQDEFGPL